MTVEFGWTRIKVHLSEIRLNASIEVQEESKEYGWSSREAPILFGSAIDDLKEGEVHPRVVEFENHGNIRFSRGKALTAKASTVNWMEKIHLGYPDSEESRQLPYLEFSLRALDIEPQKQNELLRYSSVGHSPADDMWPEKSWLELYIPNEDFDIVEKAVLNGFDDFEVGLNIKCLHEEAYVADTEIYIPRDRDEEAKYERIQVEMAFIAFSNQSLDNTALIHEDTGYEEVEQQGVTVDQQLLAQIVQQVVAIKSAVWLLAGLMIGLVLKLFL